MLTAYVIVKRKQFGVRVNVSDWSPLSSTRVDVGVRRRGIDLFTLRGGIAAASAVVDGGGCGTGRGANGMTPVSSCSSCHGTKIDSRWGVIPVGQTIVAGGRRKLKVDESAILPVMALRISS